MNALSRRTTLAGLTGFFAAKPVLADLKNTIHLPELKIATETDPYALSQKDFDLVNGQLYAWDITVLGGDQYQFHTDLFRSVWVNQIVSEGHEVHMNGAPAWLEYDKPGTFRVDFITVRTGKYKWWVKGLEDKGLAGTITVKGS